MLYTTSLSSRAAGQTLASLREFAAQQGWAVAHEVYDLAPLRIPARLRTGWCTAMRLLAMGQVTGLVAPAEREVAGTHAEQTALREWLLGLPAFAAYPHTTRHTTLPTSDMPAGAPEPDRSAPVDREWSQSYVMHPASLRRLRCEARTRLTLLRWPGDITTAIEVLSRLLHDTVTHAQPADGAPRRVTLRLAVTEDEELVIDVQDPRPGIPVGSAAPAGETWRDLVHARLLGAKVDHFLSEDACFRTVRAVLLPGEVSL
ncbi:hypothetical protein BIV23_08020 [Streptomyces monashensis]|uniref:Histidine kinase/HSP90-like ATPase domain-containing protein n=1 Tax=Streptomyces monashensis TaxID=1678012 RepID=A0A1S2QLW5_9ACTN|nr:hypothetical protein BIV23_08020 [Streptomyces monashensis]